MLASLVVEDSRDHVRTLLAEAERERRLAPARSPGVWAAAWAAVSARLQRGLGAQDRREAREPMSCS